MPTTPTATPPYRHPSAPWSERGAFVVLSSSPAWSEGSSRATRRRATGALVIVTVLTLACAAPVVLVATLAWLGSATSAAPFAAVIVALALFAALLTRGRQTTAARALRVRTRDEAVEVRRGERVLAACALPGQNIAVQHFVAQRVAALSLLAQSGERVVFWADYDGHALFDPSIPVDQSAGEFDFARFDQHVELRARSLAQLCNECRARQRASDAVEPRTRVALSEPDELVEEDPQERDARAREGRSR